MPAAARKDIRPRPNPPGPNPGPLPVPDEEEEDDGSSGGRRKNIPLVSVLDRPAMETSRDLLMEAESIQHRMKEDEARLKEIKESLCNVAGAYDVPGLRFNGFALEYHGWRTKKTLDKGLLLENGVSAETIAQSYKEGKPFQSARFIHIPV